MSQLTRLEMYQAGMSDDEIAKAECVQRNTIAFWRFKNGKLPVNKKLSPVMAKRFEMYQAGMSDREIAEAEGVGRRVIASWRRNSGKLPANRRAAVYPSSKPCHVREALELGRVPKMLRFLDSLCAFADMARVEGIEPDVNLFMVAYREVGGV